MKNSNYNNSNQIAVCALNASLLAISAQIHIPVTPPITLQLAVVFFICGFFNFKTAFISISIYLLCGFIGLPVFSGFTSGVTAITSTTGGFLVGFLFIPIIFLLYKDNSLFKICLSYGLSIVVCYLFGILWLYFYLNSFSGAIISVVIFLPIDIIKAILAHLLINSIKNRINK